MHEIVRKSLNSYHEGGKTTTTLSNKKEAVRSVITIEQRDITQQTVPKAPLALHIRVPLSSIPRFELTSSCPFSSFLAIPNHDSFAF
jgi:hypothetical protein